MSSQENPKGDKLKAMLESRPKLMIGSARPRTLSQSRSPRGRTSTQNSFAPLAIAEEAANKPEEFEANKKYKPDDKGTNLSQVGSQMSIAESLHQQGPLKTLLEAIVEQNAHTTQLLKVLIGQLQQTPFPHVGPLQHAPITPTDKSQQFESPTTPLRPVRTVTLNESQKADAEMNVEENEPQMCRNKQKVSVSVPDVAVKLVNKLGRQFETELKKFVKIKSTIESMKKDLKVMKESTKFEYPSGTRPFNAPTNIGDIDLPWKEVDEKDFMFQVKVPKGATKREALTIIHHKFIQLTKECVVGAFEVQLNSKKLVVSKQHFVESTMLEVQDKVNPNLVDTLAEVDESAEYVVDECELEHIVNSKYDSLVTNVKWQLTQAQQKADKAAERKKKTDEAIASSDPAVILEHVVKDIVKQVVQPGVNAPKSEGPDAEQFVEVMSRRTKKQLKKHQQESNPKNGFTPGGAQGRGKGNKAKPKTGNPTKPKGKGKGKGNGKPSAPPTGRGQTRKLNNPKSKGKGGKSHPKGANPWKPKGKGKGKGKNKGGPQGKGKGSHKGKNPNNKGKGKSSNASSSWRSNWNPSKGKGGKKGAK